jgi:DNA-binding SARP family transcriptional activator
VDYRILGPLEVWNGDQRVELRGATQRSVLAVFLLSANEPVRTEQLVNALWGETPPETAPRMIRNSISQLRKVLGGGEPFAALATGAAGYVLQLDPAELDATRFERLVRAAAEAAAHGDHAAAAGLAHEGLLLWRGPPLADFTYDAFAQAEIARLDDLRLAAIEQRIEAELALGRHDELVAELEALVSQHPLRERMQMQLMLALYRSGRQAEALAAYQAARRLLAEELGLEPGPALQRLERAILTQDPRLELEPSEAPEPQPATVRPARKVVTGVCAEFELRGPPLDPETAAALTNRVVAALRRPLEALGASVATESGRVVGVFGIPTVEEDDALRAVQAAIELQAVPRLVGEELEREWNVHLGIGVGIHTGAVVVGGGPSPPVSAAGLVLEAAARLARAVPEDQVLLTQETERRVRSATRLEPAEPVDVAGTAEPAWRLLEVFADAVSIPRALDAPLVGRSAELEQLLRAFERTVRTGRSHLVTILGVTGIGKSRVARELTLAVADQARVLAARCVPTGEGATFRPLADLVRGAAGAVTPEAIQTLVRDEPEAETIVAALVGALGGGAPEVPVAETSAAARKLFAAVARAQPLVLLVEDIHEAEPTFLDVLDRLVDGTHDAPMLVLCLARPELLELRGDWGGGKLNAGSILLEPLSRDESELIVQNAGGARLAAAPRIVDAAEGNPLFLEQMVAMALESEPRELDVHVPPTIQALLAARLDRLDPAERAVLECAAVVGREFSRDTVADLVPPDLVAAVAPCLEGLTRREFVGPAAARSRDTVFRFRHGLIREAAYDAIPRATRAELHEELARRIERDPAAAEDEELLGYHLEQAYHCRREVGAVDEHARVLGARAASLLGAAGRRAYAAGDIPAAVSLLSRAAELLDVRGPERLSLLPDLGEALRESGDYPRADLVLTEAVEAAAAAGDRVLEAYARILRLRMRVQTDPELHVDALHDEAERAVVVFEEADDERRLAKAWELIAWGWWIRCQARATDGALQRSIAYARRSGDTRTEAQSLHLLLGGLLFGPLPASRASERCNAVLNDPGAQKRVIASALRALAGLRAMEGNFDEARSLMARCRQIVTDLGLRVTLASAAETQALIEILAGDPVAATRHLLVGYESLERLGVTSTRWNLASLLAQSLCLLGRPKEAVAIPEIGELAPNPDDLSAQVHWRTARATVLAGLDRLDEAAQVAAEAVALARRTDFVVMTADALAAQAAVLARTGDVPAARALYEDAIRLYEQKENAVQARAARTLLEPLAAPAPKVNVSR